MRLPVLRVDHTPIALAGGNVWVIHRHKPERVHVLSVVFEMTIDHEEPGKPGEQAFFFMGYRTNPPNASRRDFLYLPCDVFKTRREAAEDAKWHPVTHVSAKTWEKAIGSEAVHEDSELGSCCGTIGEIRDLLLQCQKDGGIMERDRRKLESLLASHTRPTKPDGNPPPHFERILKKLGLASN